MECSPVRSKLGLVSIFPADSNGGVAVMFGLVAPALFLAAAMAMDYTNFVTERAHLQSAADAAALNAAHELELANPDLLLVPTAAKTYAFAELGPSRSDAV